MATVNLDDFKVNLTLDYNAFIDGVNKARDNFKKLFADAATAADTFNTRFSVVADKIANYKTGPKTFITKAITEMTQLSGVSDELKNKLIHLSDTFNKAGGKAAAVKEFSVVRNEIRELIYSEEEQQRVYEKLAEAEKQYAEKSVKRANAQAVAQEEAVGRINPALDKVERATRDYQHAEQDLTNAIIARNNAMSKMVSVEADVEAKRAAYKAASNAAKDYYNNTPSADFREDKYERLVEKAEYAYGAYELAIRARGRAEASYKQYASTVIKLEDSANKAAEKKRDTELRAIDEIGAKKAKVAEEEKKAAEALQKKTEETAEASVKAIDNVASSISALISTIGITKSFKTIIESAGSAEKATRRLESVFGNLGATAQDTAKEISKTYGMSETAAKQSIGYVGNLLVTYGLAKDEALDMAASITTLGADLASFSGSTKTASEAVDSLTQALLGNYRATRDLGVSITETEVKQFAKQLGMATDNLTQGQLALLRYKAIMAQTKLVVGDFARSQDTYYVAMQNIKAAIEDLKVALGSDLLPIITSFLNMFTSAIKALSESSSAVKGTITSFMSVLIVFSSLSTVLKPMLRSVNSLIYGVSNLSSASKAYTVQAILAKNATADWTTKQLALNAAQNANKIAVILTAVAALISLITFGINKYKDAKEEQEDFAGSTTKAVSVLNDYNDALEKQRDLLDDTKVKSTEVARAIAESNEERQRALALAALDSVVVTYKGNKEQIAKLRKEIKAAEDEILDYKKLIDDAKKAFGSGNILGDRGLEIQIDDYREYVTEANKDIDELQQKLSNLIANEAASINSLARLYYKMPELFANLQKDVPELFTAIKNAADYIKRAEEAGYDIDDTLQLIGVDTEDWVSKLEEVNKELASLQNEKLEAEGEYSEVLAYNIGLLDKERQAYEKNAQAKIDFDNWNIGDTMRQSGWSESTVQMVQFYYKKYYSAIREATDEATRDAAIADLRTYLSETLHLSDDTIASYISHIEDLVHVEEWYNLEREVLEKETDDKLLSHREKLTDSLIALENKQNKTIEEQRSKALSDLEDKYEEHLKNLYSSYGGKSGILDVLNLGADENTAAAFDTIYKAIREGKASLVNVNTDENFVNLGDLTLYGEKVTAFFDEMLTAYNAYSKGKSSIDDEYNKKYTDAIAKQKQTVAELEAERLQDQKKIYEASLAALNAEEQERKDAADVNGESLTAIEKEYQLKRLALEREYNNKILDSRNALTEALIESELALYEDSPIKPLNYEELLNKSKTTALIGEFKSLLQSINKELNLTNYQYDNLFAAVLGGVDGSKTEDEIKKVFEVMLARIGVVDKEFETLWKTMWNKIKKTSKTKAQEVADDVIDAFDTILDAMDRLFSALDQFSDNSITVLKNQIAEMKEEYEAFQEAIEKRNDQTNDNMTVAQKDALARQKQLDEEELARLEEQMKEKEALIEEEERKQFARQKALAAAQAAIDGARAAVKAYADGGAYAGPILAAIISGLTAAQIAAILAQPYPSYAVGAYELPQDQTAQVHKGEMIIPKPFAEEIRENGGFSADSNVIVNVYGATDEVTVEELDDDSTKQLNIFLTKRVKQMVNTGELDSSLQSRYAISRTSRRG